MKKIMVVLLCTVSMLSVSAQRFATGAHQNSNGVKFTHKVQTLTDAAGNDTLTVTPNAWETLSKITAVDSVSISFAATYAQYGDTYNLFITGASGTHYVRFVGSYYIIGATGNITLTSTKGCFIRFRYDGAKWVEMGRSLQ